MNFCRLFTFFCFIVLVDRPDIVQAQAKDTCGERTIHNKFGERPETYTKKTVVYVYDFSQKSERRKFYKVFKKGDTLRAEPVDLNSEYLKSGSDVYLKVVNINKFLYNLYLSKNEAADKAGPGPLVTKNFLGDSMILGSWLGAFVNDADIKKLTDDNGDLKSLYQKIDTFLYKYDSLNAEALTAYNPCKVFVCCDTPRDWGYLDLVKRLIDIRTETVDISTLLDKVKDLLKTNTANLNDCNNKQKKLDKLIDSIRSETKATPQQQHDSAILASQLCKGDDISNYKAKIEKLSAMVAAMSSVNNLLAHLPTESDLKQMIVFLNNMVKSDGEGLYPLEVDANGLVLYLHIRPRGGIDSYFSRAPDSIPVVHRFIPVLGRPFLNFSFGPFVGFPKNLENVTYTWQQLPDNTNTVRPTGNYLLVQSGYTRPPLGFAAMANFEWKCVRSLGLGVAGGAGLTFESNPRLTAMAGGSIFIGNWRQLAITAGILAMEVNRLANNWQTVADKGIVYTTEPPISYYKELKAGGFISLTFTPFSIRKQK